MKALAAFLCWQETIRHVPKILRYSLGARIDGLFAEIIETISYAYFSARGERSTHIDRAITKNDTLKFMLYALSELHGISEKQFIDITTKVEEIGKMLYGWKNQIPKENRPANARDGN